MSASTIGGRAPGGSLGRAIAHAAGPPAVWAAILGAWLLAIAAAATGNAALLHHHALIEGGPPPWVAVPLFLAGWQVMTVAMMLPASLPAIRAVSNGAPVPAPLRRVVAPFLLAFAAAWSAFGLLAFGGDVVVHHVVDATPWLAARPWLVEAGVLALAGAWQLVPAKRRSLAACRHPEHLEPAGAGPRPGALRLGLRHAFDCIASSWALMLLMFAEGFASLWWMAALAALMVYESTGRHGQRAATVAGALLLLAGIAATRGPAGPIG